MAKHLYCLTSYSRHPGFADFPPQSPPYKVVEKKRAEMKAVPGFIPDGSPYLISYKDIALAVRETPTIDYKNIPRETLLLHLMAHQSVIEQIMKEKSAVPIKFGTLAVNDLDAWEMLELGYARLKEAVDEMNDKVEIEVIARWNDLGPVMKDIGSRGEIRRFKEDIGKSGQENYQERAVELGRLVKTVLNEENCRIRGEMMEFLNSGSINSRFHDVLDDRMVMNAAFLIRKGDEKLWKEKVRELEEKWKGKIDFRIVGPLPPHSFSTLEIKRIKAKEVRDNMKILELNQGAGKAEIKEAYRRLAHKCHPDKNPGDPDAGKRFERIKDAYQNLLNLDTTAYWKDAVMIKVVS